MTHAQAKTVEYAIILLCVGSLVAIFQPFSLQAFSIGCVTIFVGGLAFNLIPFCRQGVPAKKLLKVTGIVLVVLAVAALLGIATAELYVVYLESFR